MNIFLLCVFYLNLIMMNNFAYLKYSVCTKKNEFLLINSFFSDEIETSNYFLIVWFAVFRLNFNKFACFLSCGILLHAFNGLLWSGFVGVRVLFTFRGRVSLLIGCFWAKTWNQLIFIFSSSNLSNWQFLFLLNFVFLHFLFLKI